MEEQIRKRMTWRRREILTRLEDGEKTRKRLGELLVMPRTTIFDNLDELRDLSLVDARKEKRSGKRGRPKKIWSITTRGKRILEELKKEAMKRYKNKNKVYSS